MNCSLAVAEGKELGAVFPFFMKGQARKAECKTVTPGGSDGKESACNVGDLDLIPGLGRSPGGGHGNPLHSCLGNPMDRGAWKPMVHRITKTQTRLK